MFVTPEPSQLAPSIPTAPESIHPSAEAESFDRSAQAAIAFLSPSQVFAGERLSQLNQRSNRKGGMQLALHLAVMVGSGALWLTHTHTLWIGLPALVLYGFSLAACFAPLHECIHRTAFASAGVNDAVAWGAGLLSFYNSTFYRRYHKWHHRYTRIPGKDPELTDPTPQTLGDCLWQVSGIPWWIGKLQGHFRCALGQLEDCPYIAETVRPEVQRSVQMQLAVYATAIAFSLVLHYPWFIVGWLLPLAVGQPILRFILLAEHTGCTLDANPFANTRTTLTALPLRLLMWNMPYHTEHHFCPSLPFHALGEAHKDLRPHLTQVEPGYIAVNVGLIRQLGDLPH